MPCISTYSMDPIRLMVIEDLWRKAGAKRVEAAKQALGSVGGSLEAFYFSFGENDFYIIVELSRSTQWRDR